jgi:alpha-galactosidase
VPYFRKNAQMVEEDLVPRFTDKVNHWFQFGRTGGYLRHSYERLESFRQEFKQIMVDPIRTDRTHEYGSFIIEAIETNQPLRINGNVPNHQLIDNLPLGCCVEVPCLVDRNGVQPTHFGPLPPQLAALNRTNINVQELIVEAAVNRKRDAIYHAVALDPLTSAVCTLPQIHEMVDELFAAQEQWLEYLR